MVKRNLCIISSIIVVSHILYFSDKKKREKKSHGHHSWQSNAETYPTVWGGETCWRGQCHQSVHNLRSDIVND